MAAFGYVFTFWHVQFNGNGAELNDQLERCRTQFLNRGTTLRDFWERLQNKLNRPGQGLGLKKSMREVKSYSLVVHFL